MHARSAAPSPGRPWERTPDPRRLRTHNRALLSRLSQSRQKQARLRWRNALVENNLALVRMVAQRESRRTGLPFDELCSVGFEALVHAVEGFDTSREVSLSSYVVPCLRGAMLQDRRDRQQPLQTPRRLRELHQKAERWLEQRRAAGLAAPDGPGLAMALGCTVLQLEEAGRVHRALQLCSLDAPVAGGDSEGGCSRLEQLADPATALPPCAEAGQDPQLRWLREQLARLTPEDQRLVEGHWLDGLSWSDLALELARPARACRLRGAALLAELQAAAMASQTPMASTAARVV
ncbi:sigma-70 family RNA polymerase sigma factor [Cyanobium sp. NIES-981]|uniref:sigma-70 family RNA polymerase sigma factor n=1 Tax=Cyanobium sp. NIES-981 TaxID=1851505 RepID=UPI0007DCC042|nr:sigma-70 family RNA polymerase sigma factor [Cyanobium sp. NIES-981]SBO41915.1 RNA polymerase sigma factor, sigma-70 family [Cyanobium sp. NIES-981]